MTHIIDDERSLIARVSKPITTVQVHRHISAQGPLVHRFPDGRATVDADGALITGREIRRACAAGAVLDDQHGGDTSRFTDNAGLDSEGYPRDTRVLEDFA